MRRRRSAPAGVVASALLVGGCWVRLWPTTTTAPPIERRAEAARPVGSTRPRVEAWLAARGFEFGFTDDPREHSRVAEPFPDPRPHPTAVVGLLRDTDTDFIVTGSIPVCFLFGPDGRLARRLVWWVGTGP